MNNSVYFMAEKKHEKFILLLWGYIPNAGPSSQIANAFLK